MGIVTGPSAMAAEYPEIPALQSVPGGATEAIIPEKLLKKACQLVPKSRTLPALNHLAVVLGEKRTTLATTDGETATLVQPRNLEGVFPDTAKVMEQVEKYGPPRVSVRLDPQLLGELLTVARSFTDAEHQSITLDIWDASKLLVVKSSNGQEQQFTGVLVPLAPRV
jgi:hypothetical protein